jgi:nucleoid DNA-binding protein
MAPSNSMVSNVLAAEVAKKSGLSNVTNDQVKHILETMCQHILDTVKEGNDVSFPKFLKFKRVLRKERTFKSPKGESVVKPEHYVMTVSVMANAKKHMSDSSSSDEDKPMEEEKAPMQESEDEKPKKKPVRKTKDEESEPKKKPAARKQKKAKEVEEEEKSFVVESDSD